MQQAQLLRLNRQGQQQQQRQQHQQQDQYRTSILGKEIKKLQKTSG